MTKQKKQNRRLQGRRLDAALKEAYTAGRSEQLAKSNVRIAFLQDEVKRLNATITSLKINRDPALVDSLQKLVTGHLQTTHMLAETLHRLV